MDPRPAGRRGSGHRSSDRRSEASHRTGNRRKVEPSPPTRGAATPHHGRAATWLLTQPGSATERRTSETEPRARPRSANMKQNVPSGALQPLPIPIPGIRGTRQTAESWSSAPRLSKPTSTPPSANSTSAAAKISPTYSSPDKSEGGEAASAHLEHLHRSVRIGESPQPVRAGLDELRANAQASRPQPREDAAGRGTGGPTAGAARPRPRAAPAGTGRPPGRATWERNDAIAAGKMVACDAWSPGPAPTDGPVS